MSARKKANPGGRPTKFSPELVRPFLDMIATAKTTADAARAIGVNPSTIFDWLAKHEMFAKSYARAKEAAADFIVEEMLAIIDDSRNDFTDGKNGPVFNPEAVARSRLRFDGRKWLAAKLRPSKYGDKLDLAHGVTPGNPLDELIRSIQGSAIKIVARPSERDEND